MNSYKVPYKPPTTTCNTCGRQVQVGQGCPQCRVKVHCPDCNGRGWVYKPKPV